ncbi:septation protein SepH [Corynebacterium sp. ZY180755]
MRELILSPSESTRESLVFSAVDGDEQFFLAVDDSLRATLLGESPSDTPTTEESPAQPVDDEQPPQAEPEDSGKSAEAEASEKPAEPVAIRQPRPQREVDPRVSTPLKMRPREIQEKVRGGASVAELAEENGVTEARIEAYAHPVLLERARIAQMAKQAHPVRDDGPAKLTLWEVLATAFAARGLDLTTTEWDSYKDPAGQWVIKMSWKAGLSENVAEWAFMRHGMSSATAVARNGIAADLIDPDFAQPVRTLSPVGRSNEAPRGLDALIGPGTSHDDEREPVTDTTRDDIPVVTDEHLADETQEVEGDEFLQHPDSKPATKRKRKAVTPHWEDVLLGVRTNTKRPRK